MKSYSSFIACAVFFWSPNVGHSQQEHDYNHLGRMGYALWDCATTATLFESDPEISAELFERGHKMLTILVGDIVAGKVSKDDISEVPVGIQWAIVGGPSVDFRLGYIWSEMLNYTSSEVAPKTEAGSYEQRKGLLAMTAQNRFLDSNCELLLK